MIHLLFFFFQKDSWLAWMPRALWRADVLEHEWFLCFIFNTTHFPLILNHFCRSRLCCFCLFELCSLGFFFLFIIILSLVDFELTQFPFPLFLLILLDWFRLLFYSAHFFSNFLFFKQRLYLLEGHKGEVFLLDTLLLHTQVFGQCKWVV